MLAVWTLWAPHQKLWPRRNQELPSQTVKPTVTEEEQPSGTTPTCPRSDHTMVSPSPVLLAMINGQQVPYLINAESKVTTMEYDLYLKRLRSWNLLDPSWLTLKAPNNLPIVVEEGHMDVSASV